MLKSRMETMIADESWVWVVLVSCLVDVVSKDPRPVSRPWFAEGRVYRYEEDVCDTSR